ncbi:STAS domain-containing protein [Streptomyces sp. NPDC029674]|uniref:STAS domain-containing protein n=1 Tax=Streptomyces sp. NPDC029674 TaxID=3365297 RepID=UPI00385130C1
MGQLVIHRTSPDAHHSVTLTLVGELDVGSISEFCDIVVRTLRSDGRHLMVDLDGITYCDNGSLYTILGIRHATDHVGGSLAITAASAPVHNALHHNGLHRVLTITPQ